MVLWGLLIFIFLIFVQPQDFMPGLKGLPLVAIVMGAVGVGWFLNLMSHPKFKLFGAPQSKLMLSLWIVIVLSTLSVHWFSFTVYTLFEWGKVLLIYFFFISLVDSLRKLQFVFLTVVVAMAITAGMGVLQYYGIDFTGVGTQLGGRIRGIGIFDTNQLAYSCSFCVPYVFCLLYVSKGFLSRLLYFAILSIYAYCIYLTQSRGGAICLIMTVLLSFLFFNKSKVVKILGLIVSGCGFLVLLVLSARLASVSQFQDDESAMKRLYVWGDSLVNLKSCPLGIGKGQFVDRFGMAAHSSYVEVLSELGLVGLLLWLGLFYFSIRNLRYLSRVETNSEHRIISFFSRSVLISMIAYLMGSLFSSSSYYITLYLMFSFVVILQYRSDKVYLDKCMVFTGKDSLVLVCLEIIVIVLLSLWVKLTT